MKKSKSFFIVLLISFLLCLLIAPVQACDKPPKLDKKIYLPLILMQDTTATASVVYPPGIDSHRLPTLFTVIADRGWSKIQDARYNIANRLTDAVAVPHASITVPALRFSTQSRPPFPFNLTWTPRERHNQDELHIF